MGLAEGGAVAASLGGAPPLPMALVAGLAALWGLSGRHGAAQGDAVRAPFFVLTAASLIFDALPAMPLPVVAAYVRPAVGGGEMHCRRP